MLADPTHAKETVPFPGPSNVFVAANGVMKVVNTNPPDRNQLHTLSFVGGDINRVFYEYRRHVEVSWGPDSRHVFLITRDDEDKSTCMIFSVDNQTRIDLFEPARQFSPEAARILSYGHHYLECGKWFEPNKILVKLHGYDSDEAKGELWLAYDLNTGFGPAPPLLLKHQK
jgi:hypothetical protein